MALFKILKGSSSALGKTGNSTYKATEGYAYFTQDDGKFYIDIADANQAQVGVNRIPLNARAADYLVGTDVAGRNLIQNTLFKDNNNLPNLNGVYHFTPASNCTLTASDAHGLILKETAACQAALYLGSSSNTANANQIKINNLDALAVNTEYTLAFDLDYKLLSGATNSTTYYINLDLYVDKTTAGTFDTTALQSKRVAEITSARKGITVTGTRVEFTFVLPTNVTMLYFRLYCTNTTANQYAVGDFLQLNNIKLERGPVATYWTPAPEDERRYLILNNKTLQLGNSYSLSDLNLASGNGRIFYGTCTTAAGTAAKVVTCADYNQLQTGDILVVSFSNTNTAAVANLTLNVNGKGAKNIKKLYNANIANLTSTNELRADAIALFVYNGTYWILSNADYNNTYSYMFPYENTSTSGAAKQAKIAIGGWKFQLTAGKQFPYTHYYDNTYQGAFTLNIGGTGDKPVWINGKPSSSSNYTLPGGNYIVYYDGTNYHFRTDGIMPGKTQTGRYFHNVIDYGTAGTPKEILIKTRIPYTNANVMPKLIFHINNYHPGLPTELGLVFYIYDGEFVNYGATSNTEHRPVITLSSYIENGQEYVAIGLGLIGTAVLSEAYYIHFNIDMFEYWPSNLTRDYSQGWSVIDNAADDASIIPTEHRVTVSYKDYTAKAGSAAAFTSGTTVKLTGDVTGESSSSTKGWSVATTIGAGKVTNAMLAGSIANSKLANSSITVGNKIISLGGTGTLDDIIKAPTQIGVDSSWDITTTGAYYVASSSAFTGTNNPGTNQNAPYAYGALYVIRAGNGGAVQFYISHNASAAQGKAYGIRYRSGWNVVDGTNPWKSWATILDDKNYNLYTPTLTGTGASGTWPISITGSAATISTSGGTTAKFWRGDNTWSDTISGGTLKISNHSITVEIGAQNGSWIHFTNGQDKSYYFDHQISAVNGFKVYNTNTALTNNTLTFANGGGWKMTDETWIRTVGSKNIYQDSGTFRTDGTFQVGPNGQYAQINSSGIKFGDSGTAVSNGANLITVNGHIVINGSYNTSNSYSEGIRINRSSNGWSVVTLGGTQGTLNGTGNGVWLVGAYSTPANATAAAADITDSNFYISYNGSNSAASRIQGHVATGWSIRPHLGINIAPDVNYALKVAGGKSWLQGPLLIGSSDTAGTGSGQNGYAMADSGSNNYLAFYGVHGDGPAGFNHTYIGESIYGPKDTANEKSELLLFKGNDVNTTSGPDRIRLFANQVDVQVYEAALSGSWDTIRATTGTQVANFAKGKVTINGETNTKTVIIASTAAESHIKFSRSSWNYVTYPDNAASVLAVGFGTGDSANQQLVIYKTGLVRPGADNTQDLGDTSHQWKTVYAYKFHGDLDGTATGAKCLVRNDGTDYNLIGLRWFDINGTAGHAAQVNDTPTTAWWHILRMHHSNSNGYYTDLAVPFGSTNHLYYKRLNAGAVVGTRWIRIIDDLGGLFRGNVQFTAANDAISNAANNRISWYTLNSNGTIKTEQAYMAAASNGNVAINALNAILLRPGTGSAMDTASKALYITQGSIYSYATKTHSLGDASHEFNGVYSTNGTFSDTVHSKVFNNLITGTGTAQQDKGSGVSPRYFPVKWTYNIGRNVADGDTFLIKIPIAGHTWGVYISMNNGTNYYPVVLNGTGRLTTHYPVNNYLWVTFEAAGSAASMTPIDGADSVNATTVTGGAFRVLNYYDSNSTTISNLYIANGNHIAANVIYRYQLLFQVDEDHLCALTSTSNSTGTSKTMLTSQEFLLDGLIYYYGTTTTVNADAAISAGALYYSYPVDLRYTFNTGTTLTAHKNVYLKVIPTTGRKCKIASVSPIVQVLPSSNDGNCYILLGRAYNTYCIMLYANHPVYQYTDHLYTVQTDTKILNSTEVKRLIFSDKTAIKHIEFTRTADNSGPSYICYPETGSLAIGFATGYDNTIALFDGKTALRPGKNNEFNLGTASFAWKNLYAGIVNGHVLATHAAGGSAEIKVQYSSTISYWWGVGTANVNHGLYDDKVNKWIISAGANNQWTFDGHATDSTFLVSRGRLASADTDNTYRSRIFTFLASTSMTTGKPRDDGIITQFNWDNSYWAGQLYIPASPTGMMQYRGSGQNANTWGDWKTLLDTANYSSLVTTLSNALTAPEVIANHKMVINGGRIYTNVSGSNVLLSTGTSRLFGDGLAISNPTTSNDVGWIRMLGTGETDSVLEIATGDDGGTANGETIVVRQYNTSNAVSKEAILLDKQTGATTFPVSVTAPTFIGSLSGNATSSTNAANTQSNYGAKEFIVEGDANTYYPVWFNGYTQNGAWTLLNIHRGYNEQAPDTWNTSTHRNGLTLTILSNGDTAWGGNHALGISKLNTIIDLSEQYSTVVADMQVTNFGLVIWLRGGGAKYWVTSNGGRSVTVTPWYESHTQSSSTVAPTTTINTTRINSFRWNNLWTITNATQFSSNRTIALTGAITGSASANGSSGWSIATTVNHTHSYITSRGNVTCETAGNKPAQAGLSMSNVYNNGYPVTYGNVLTMYGAGAGQLLLGWSGSSTSSTGVHSGAYIRSQRDTAGSLWSDWVQLLDAKNTYVASSSAVSVNWNTETTIATINGTAVKIKIPANPNTNTDTLVKQTVKTDNVNYKLLATTSASPSSGTAMEATYSAYIFANPSTGALSAPRHMLNIGGTNKAYMSYNSTDDSIDFVFV